MDYITGFQAIFKLGEHYSAQFGDATYDLIEGHQRQYDTLISSLGYTPQAAFDTVSLSILQDVYVMSGVGEFSDMVGYSSPLEALNALSTDKLLAVLYPEGDATAETRDAILSGTYNIQEILAGNLQNFVDGNTSPSLAEVIAMAREALGIDMPRDDQPLDFTLIDAGLTFPGLSDGQLDFLIAMYIGSFGRAPEYDGLAYWAKEMSDLLAAGNDFGAASQQIGGSLYHAGQINGESGTDLGTRDFVAQTYHNALGREPDPSGFDYWVNELDTGILSRGVFMATFINAALANGGDREHIIASVAVAEHVAQQHISGTITQDNMHLLHLVREIDGVERASQIIETLMNDFPGPEILGVQYDSGFSLG